MVSPYTDRITQNQYFVHSKLYIIDQYITYSGSLNFTLPGQKYNFESCIRTEDEGLAYTIIDELQNFNEDSDMFFRDIDLIGSDIYSEPLNKLF